MRIRLDKNNVFYMVSALALLITGGSAGYYYFFVRPMYGIYHEDLLVPGTAVRIVFKPVLVQDYVSSLAPKGSKFIPGIPKVSSLQQMSFRTEWIHKMPFEFSFLLDQRSPDHLGVLFFVKEHPASESFADLVDEGGFFHALRPIEWEQSRMASHGIRTLVASGLVPIPGRFQKSVSIAHPDYKPLTSPEIQGRYFLEAAIKNGNGAILELYGAFSGVMQSVFGAENENMMIEMSPVVEDIRMTASLAGDDMLTARLEIECTGSVMGRSVLESALEMAATFASYLERTNGFELMFEGAITGSIVTIDCSLTGFEEKLRRALGG